MKNRNQNLGEIVETNRTKIKAVICCVLLLLVIFGFVKTKEQPPVDDTDNIIFIERAPVEEESVYGGLKVDRNDTDGPGPNTDNGPGRAYSVAEKRESGSWLPPEDFLTMEDKEFRQAVIEAAGLEPDSPDLDEQLAKLYRATSSSQFPNEKTYRLFIDRIIIINQSQNH